MRDVQARVSDAAVGHAAAVKAMLEYAGIGLSAAAVVLHALFWRSDEVAIGALCARLALSSCLQLVVELAVDLASAAILRTRFEADARTPANARVAAIVAVTSMLVLVLLAVPLAALVASVVTSQVDDG